MRDAPVEPWVRFAAAHEASTAVVWKRALLDVGITAVVEIEDARRVTSVNAPWGARGPSMFLHGISVPLEERERARAIVSGAGPAAAADGVRRESSTVRWGMFVVLMGAAFLFTARSGWW